MLVDVQVTIGDLVIGIMKIVIRQYLTMQIR